MVSRFKKKFENFAKDYYIIFAFMGLCIILTIITDRFATPSNITTILRQAAIIAIVSCGQYFVMVGGAFDLSVGATAGLSGVVFASGIVLWGMPIWVSVILCLIVGLTVGLFNGILVTKINIPPFIATLAAMSISRGMAYVITNAIPVTPIPKEINWIGRGVIGDPKTFGMPVPVIIMFVVYIIAFIISEKTRLGRKFFAIGGNEDASYLSGLNVHKLKILTFMIAGLLASFASIIMVSRLSSGSPSFGEGYEFDSVTACVIGGVLITGGKGKVLGVLVGALFLTTFFNGMTLLNVNSFYQDVLKGVVLTVAVGFNTLKSAKKR